MEDFLLAELGKGNKNAFDRLYALFKSRVYRIALGHIGHEEDAEELTQDIFLTIYRSSAQFKGQCSAATWIYRVAVNKSLDKLRYLKAKKRFAFVTSIFADENAHLKEIGDLSHHGIEADRREDVRTLLKALEEIPDQQRSALVLTQLEGLSGREAAAVLEVSPKAVEGLIQRGKANLKKTLEKFYENDGGKWMKNRLND